MSLHDRIMALPKRTPGQKDTVHKAAQIAKEADELMGDMAEALDVYADCIYAHGVALAALNRYKYWKEQSK